MQAENQPSNTVNTPEANAPVEFPLKNRDIDWLTFNSRVLQEAENEDNPLYERIKFLAIFSSNLDEFFKVRISKLRQIRKVQKSIRKPLALKPNKTLKFILKEIHEQQEWFGRIYRESILPGLKGQGIELQKRDDYSVEDKNALSAFFRDVLAPGLEVFHLDAVERNRIEDGKLFLVVVPEESDELLLVPIPVGDHNRFVRLPTDNKGYFYTFIEDVIAEFIGDFLEQSVMASYCIKISRDAELYLEDDYEGEWIQQIYESLKNRQEGQPTRLLYEGSMPKAIQKQLRKSLELGKVDMIQGGSHHNFSDFFDFPNPIKKGSLHYTPLPQIEHRNFSGDVDIFDVVSRKDQLLHYPYHSFTHLEDWVFQAAQDPMVESIEISLYRVAKKSRLTEALLLALENEVSVTLFIEAKARFDETNNLSWGEIFEDHGAKVYYSFPNIKVHCKVMMIRRIEGEGMKGYAYIGTGNFNAKSARVYCDHALLTANQAIVKDLGNVFKVLKREMILPKLKHLLVSPYSTRETFINLINNEIHLSRQGLPASIFLKMNSLEDSEMIRHLYRASAEGVKIRLLVRGICCLLPGIPGISDNIEVTSIVDRFLEHGRLYLFHNNGDEKMYIGSADWMTRNLDKRIEVLTPILDPERFKELKKILQLQLADNEKARRIDGRDNTDFVKPSQSDSPLRSQYAIYEYLKESTGID